MDSPPTQKILNAEDTQPMFNIGSPKVLPLKVSLGILCFPKSEASKKDNLEKFVAETELPFGDGHSLLNLNSLSHPFVRIRRFVSVEVLVSKLTVFEGERKGLLQILPCMDTSSAPFQDIALPQFDVKMKDAKSWFCNDFGEEGICLIAPFEDVESAFPEFFAPDDESEEVKSVIVPVRCGKFPSEKVEVLLEKGADSVLLHRIWEGYAALRKNDYLDLPQEYSIGGEEKESYSMIEFVLVSDATKGLEFFSSDKEIVIPKEKISFDPQKETLDFGKVFRSQHIVAAALEEAILKWTGPLTKFSRVEFCVTTARFTSLKDQTKARMEDLGLPSDAVFICNTKGWDDGVKPFYDRIQVEKGTLFVMVCDEAHWGVNKGGAYDRMMNAPDEFPGLSSAPNLVQIFVSATPFNLLTKESRIPKENVVVWEDVVDNPQSVANFSRISPGWNYRGLDFFVKEARAKDWGSESLLRCDGSFEKMVEQRPVITLLASYLTSIVKFYGKRGVEEYKKAEKELFAVVKSPELKTACEKMLSDKFLSSVETEKIISSLLGAGNSPCMHVVRISPGDEDEKASKDASKMAASFLKPLRILLRKLELFECVVLGDFGKESPNNMISDEPMYRSYWNKMQDTPCRECSKCDKFVPKKGKNCAACGHIHRPFECYDDLGGLRVLLVVVMKGRLGDTFPRSFMTLDMRATKRNVGGVMLSSLVQELGRLCHHQDPQNPNFGSLCVDQQTAIGQVEDISFLQGLAVFFESVH